jgi:hypothetical protein
MSYLKYYRCSCGKRWVDTWTCICNDRCPSCNLEIEPYYWEDFSEDDGDPQKGEIGLCGSVG